MTGGHVFAWYSTLDWLKVCVVRRPHPAEWSHAVVRQFHGLQRCNVLLNNNKLCGRPPQCAPPPASRPLIILTLKVMSESRVTWPTSVPILVFLGLSVLDLGPMYATDRRQTDVETRIIV